MNAHQRYFFQSPLRTEELDALKGEYVRNKEWNERPFYERLTGSEGKPDYLALWHARPS